MTSLEAEAATPEEDIRPLVGRPANNRGVWITVAAIAIGGLGLFSALEARRSAIIAPRISAPPDTNSAMFAAAPELVIPPSYVAAYPSALQLPAVPTGTILPPALAATRAPVRRPAYAMLPPPQSFPGPFAGAGPVALPSPSPAFAYQGPQRAAALPVQAARSGEPGRNDERALASKLLNPATTVPLGTVIQAVMETALDSNRAGFARAVIARDVYGFDGTRILIPKGSKLFGEYKADLSAGQNRALNQWHRLTRPDGSIIDVDSPSADPLGRAGLKGKVNSHFLARFGGSILQSALDIGVQIAARQASGSTYVLALPNSTQNLQNAVPNRAEDIRPTLTVRQGTSVSVFVGRDLDFTAVEL
jgi:type IV secretion system protein VirB10